MTSEATSPRIETSIVILPEDQEDSQGRIVQILRKINTAGEAAINPNIRENQANSNQETTQLEDEPATPIISHECDDNRSTYDLDQTFQADPSAKAVHGRLQHPL